ncbi:MAG: CAP domain-containing protein, partial [Candidatus Staskawiczbacteria bacterium]|nr:CAP domain-containing protein [Candidatus Staskawiczbacteria bacterium]
KIIIFILVIATLGAGVYFRDDVVRYYNGFGNQVKDVVEKEIFAPAPLKAGGLETKIVLLQSKIISETNLQRQQNGNLPELKENTRLNEAASAKASDILQNQYFEHVSPSGVDPGKLVQQYGYEYIVAGENLILGNFKDEKEVVQDWMDSPGHRANILNNRYSEIGVAIVKGTYKGETVWVGVQEFGLPLATCEEPNVILKNQIDSQKTQLNTLSSQIDEKRKQIENTVQDSPVYSQMVDDFNKLVVQYNSLTEQVKQNISTFNNQVNNFNACVAGK